MKSWKSMSKAINDANNLVIIDLVNIAHRVPRSVPSGKAFAKNLKSTIESFALSYNARKVVILTDKGVSSFRKELHPEYKENRAERRKQQSEAEQRAQREWFDKMKEGIKLLSEEYPIFGYKGVEADDLAAAIVAMYADRGEFDHIWLISSDGDWDLLLKDNVSRYSFYTKREYTLDEMYENSKVDNPEQFASLKALMGDRGDNINGVDGIAEKRGYGVIREYGGIFDILDQLPLPGNQMFIKNLNNSADLILRNIQLVDLLSFWREALDHAGVLQTFTDEIKEYLSND